MGQATTTRNARAYQTTVSALGIVIWLAAAVVIFTTFEWQEYLVVLALVPVILMVGMFEQHFRLPLGLTFLQDRIVVSFPVAFSLGGPFCFEIPPEFSLAGMEASPPPRRKVRRLSS